MREVIKSSDNNNTSPAFFSSEKATEKKQTLLRSVLEDGDLFISWYLVLTIVDNQCFLNIFCLNERDCSCLYVL